MIIEMQIKKTGKLFSFCCMAPGIILKKNKYLNSFEKLGSDIGLLFQLEHGIKIITTQIMIYLIHIDVWLRR